MYGEGERERNRFFPTLGNHDWGESDGRPNNIEAHKAFFTGLPGNGRYYSFSWGAANFFAVDSDEHEPDGIAPDSVQGRWLQAQLQASTAAFNIVFMHHCPYSSAAHGDQVNLQWPCADASLPCVAFPRNHTQTHALSVALQTPSGAPTSCLPGTTTATRGFVSTASPTAFKASEGTRHCVSSRPLVHGFDRRQSRPGLCRQTSSAQRVAAGPTAVTTPISAQCVCW